MTKSELIESLVKKQSQLGYRDVELAVKTMLEHMGQTLATGERIEIRGFGSFSLHYRPPRVGRNPKSGDPVSLPAKYVPHFKPGKELRERVNNGAGTTIRPAETGEAAITLNRSGPSPASDWAYSARNAKSAAAGRRTSNESTVSIAYHNRAIIANPVRETSDSE